MDFEKKNLSSRLINGRCNLTQDQYVYFAQEQVVLQTAVHNHEVTCTDEPA
jgi:hypothetical protein